MKNNNKILYISIAILVLAVGIAFGTYAYYQTTISGIISGNVASWSFKANGETSSFNLDFGSLYPGVSGTYNIELSAEYSELDVYYELYLEDHHQLNNNLYLDSEHWQNFSAYSYAGIYGVIPAGSKITVPIYLYWPYDRNDGSDINEEDGIGSNIIIEAQQYTAYTGTIPMYFARTYYANSDFSYCYTSYTDGYIQNSCGAPV